MNRSPAVVNDNILIGLIDSCSFADCFSSSGENAIFPTHEDSAQRAGRVLCCLLPLICPFKQQLYSQLEITQEHMVYFLIHVIYICQLIGWHLGIV